MLLKREDLINVFRENLSVKILALTLATVAIFSIQRITNQIDEFEVPIQIEVEPGMAILRQDARFAYITCRGSLDDLRRLDQSQLRLLVRTKTTGTAGTEQIPIGLRNVQGVPRSITVTKVRPNLLNLTFDREVQKQVNVARPEIVGRPARGRAELDYSPKIVTVRGPQQRLADLKIIQTAPIDVENATVSFSRELPILTDDERGVWEVVPEHISARVNIVTEAINREWTDLPIMILRDPETDLVFKPEPAAVNVNLLGSPQAVNQIQAEDIRVFIDCTTISEPGEHELAAVAHFPGTPDIRAAVNPPVIRVSALPFTPLSRKPDPDGSSVETDSGEQDKTPQRPEAKDDVPENN